MYEAVALHTFAALDAQTHRIAAIGARRFDDDVLVDDGSYAKAVPRAVREPRCARANDPIRCLGRGERSGHPDLTAGRMAQHRLADVQIRKTVLCHPTSGEIWMAG